MLYNKIISSDEKMTSLFAISLISFLQAKIEKQINLNLNIQTILSKYPDIISEKSAEIFAQPLKYSNSHEAFFEDIFSYVRISILFPFVYNNKI